MFRFGWTTRASDEELFRSFGQGRNRAFETLVKRYGAAIEAYARRLLRNTQLAEEVVADTFERLARDRGATILQGTFRSFVFTIAHHRCLDLLRKGRREQAAYGRIKDLETHGCRPANPENAAWQGEVAAKLEDALARLSEAHREVVLLRLVHGLSCEEAADVLGCTGEQVRSQLSYARKLLRKHLVEQSDLDPIYDLADTGKEFGTS